MPAALKDDHVNPAPGDLPQAYRAYRDRRRFIRFCGELLTRLAHQPYVARFTRAVVPECPHHMNQRGNERRDLFFSLRRPRRLPWFVAGLLPSPRRRRTWPLLMTNHVYLALMPHRADTGLGQI
jgi:hypothetical protein